MELVFYKGGGDLKDKLIRLYTIGPYSHVELRFADGSLDEAATCFSSSWRDGGTRFKQIDLTTGRWTRFEVACPHDENRVRAWCGDHQGFGYDFMGLLGFAFGKDFQNPDKWYCSEICAASLCRNEVFDFPQKISPNGLVRLVRKYPDMFPLVSGA